MDQIRSTIYVHIQPRIRNMILTIARLSHLELQFNPIVLLYEQSFDKGEMHLLPLRALGVASRAQTHRRAQLHVEAARKALKCVASANY